MNRLIGFFFVLAILGLPQMGCGGGWLIYHQQSFKGKVLDAETKEPLEGAIVLAEYRRKQLGPTGGGTFTFDLRESLTNKDGAFFIPAFTALINPLGWGRDVSFLIWKPGYKQAEEVGGYFFSKEPGTMGTKVVYLKGGGEKNMPIKLGIVELVKTRTFEERRMEMPAGPVGDEDFWKKQPNFIKMIRAEWEHITGHPAGNLYQPKEAR